MTRDHTEWPDLERPGVPHVGYTDPHEQTLSDDEVEPVHVEPLPPIDRRWNKFRLYFDRDYGAWVAHQPSDLGYPLFARTIGTTTVRNSAFVSDSGALALEALQVAIAKYEAAL